MQRAAGQAVRAGEGGAGQELRKRVAVNDWTAKQTGQFENSPFGVGWGVKKFFYQIVLLI